MWMGLCELSANMNRTYLVAETLPDVVSWRQALYHHPVLFYLYAYLHSVEIPWQISLTLWVGNTRDENNRPRGPVR